MAQARILIVDDEPSIRLFLAEELTQAGYEVTTADSGEQALALLQEQPIDLMLLDLKMRGMGGLQVMAALESQPWPPVVIVLTAYASLDSAIESMRRGGHDYLLKPCRTEELLASVEKGLARRQEALRQRELLYQIEDSARRLRLGAAAEPQPAGSGPRLLEARGLLLDGVRQVVTRLGQPVHLTPSEFKLLRYLMERADQVIPLSELMRVLHNVEGAPHESRQSLGTHIWNLRRKIGTDPDGNPYIINVRGRGYRFGKGSNDQEI